MKAEAITCQIRAIADYILSAKHTAADLRNIAVEMADTRFVIEAEIQRRDDIERSGTRALHKLMGFPEPEGGAA